MGTVAEGFLFCLTLVKRSKIACMALYALVLQLYYCANKTAHRRTQGVTGTLWAV